MTPPKTWLARRLDRTSPRGLQLTALTLGAGLALAIFGGILQGISEQEHVAQFDRVLRSLAISWRQPTLTVFLELISGVAGVKGNLVMLGLIIALLWRRRVWRLAALLTGGAIVQAVVVIIIKGIVERPRPDQAERLIHETSFSFPSGHTLGAVVIMGLFAYIIGRTVQKGWIRWGIAVLWVMWVVLVAFSRVYLGVHFPSDTAASACLGGALLSLLYSYHILSEKDLAATASHNTGVRWRLLSALGLTFLIVALSRSFFV